VSAPGFRVWQGARPDAPGRQAEVMSLDNFEDVYKAERSGLVRYLMTMGADQYQADDAVQSAFARALSGWDVIAHPRGVAVQGRAARVLPGRPAQAGDPGRRPAARCP